MIVMRIKKLRQECNLTQGEIAKVLNIGQNTYSRYETGENNISVEQLMKLANFYNTSLDFLVGKTDIRKPYEKNNW